MHARLSVANGRQETYGQALFVARDWLQLHLDIPTPFQLRLEADLKTSFQYFALLCQM